MRAAWPLVISWARMGSWATLFQSIWTRCGQQVALECGSSRTYILQTLLLEDRKEKPRHGVVVGRHDGGFGSGRRGTGLLDGVGGRIESQPTTNLAAEVREGGQLNMNLKQQADCTAKGRWQGSHRPNLAARVWGSESLVDPGVNRREVRLAAVIWMFHPQEGTSGREQEESELALGGRKGLWPYKETAESQLPFAT